MKTIIIGGFSGIAEEIIKSLKKKKMKLYIHLTKLTQKNFKNSKHIS